MYGCESWTVNKLSAEELMLSGCGSGEDPWESLGQQGDQTVNPKGNQPWVSMEAPMLKFQYFGHLMWGVHLLEKTLVLGKIESRRRTEQQRMSWMDGNTNSMDMSFERTERYWRTGEPGMLQSPGLQRVRRDIALNNNSNEKWSNDNMSVKGSNWHNLLVCVCVQSLYSCTTLCSPMDCSMPGFSSHGVFQARILEGVAISFSRESSWSRDWTHVSWVAGKFFTSEPPGKPYLLNNYILVICNYILVICSYISYM